MAWVPMRAFVREKVVSAPWTVGGEDRGIAEVP